MNRANIVCIGVAACAGLGMLAAAGLQPQPAATAQPQGGAASDAGYSIGFDIGREVAANLKQDGVGAEADAVVRGFGDALRGAKPAIPDERMAQILTELQVKIDEDKVAKKMEDPAYKAAASATAAMSKAFMEKFSQLEGVKPLENGIYYMVKKTGSGEAVGSARSVVLNYEAFLSRREQVANKEKVEVVIGSMVPGSQTVLRKMKVGDRWYVAIPPEQAFGSRGLAPNIGPNEALIVDVEVLEVKK